MPVRKILKMKLGTMPIMWEDDYRARAWRFGFISVMAV